MRLPKEDHGFTLVEMALVILISGVLMGSALKLYHQHVKEEKYRVTYDHVDLTRQAVSAFYSERGRYPCPADPTLGPGNVNYGLENCRPGSVIPDISDPCNLGSVPAGLECAESTSRDADKDGNDDPVLIGVVPFRTLAQQDLITGFREYQSIDGFEMRLTYAVSELMTDQAFLVSNPANIALGAIDVRDENNRSVVEPERSAHFIVFSHGENKQGAYSVDGERFDNCRLIVVTGSPPEPTEYIPPPGSNLGDPLDIEVDKENCDDNDALFRKTLLSKTQDDNYSDDILFFGTSNITNIWLGSRNAPVGESWIYNTNLENVGIGIDDPQATLHVNGEVRTQDKFEAQEGYCPKSAMPNPSTPGYEPDCLDPAAIDGDLANMKCGPGEAATGIHNNSLVCESVFNAALTVPSCPPGEFLTGFRTDGITATATCSP